MFIIFCLSTLISERVNHVYMVHFVCHVTGHSSAAIAYFSCHQYKLHAEYMEMRVLNTQLRNFKELQKFKTNY